MLQLDIEAEEGAAKGKRVLKSQRCVVEQDELAHTLLAVVSRAACIPILVRASNASMKQTRKESRHSRLAAKSSLGPVRFLLLVSLQKLDQSFKLRCVHFVASSRR